MREKEGGVRLARVGGALELMNNERVECGYYLVRQRWFVMLTVSYS